MGEPTPGSRRLAERGEKDHAEVEVVESGIAAAGLVTAWGGGQAKAAPYFIEGYVEPSQALTNVAIITGFDRRNRADFLGLAIAGHLPPEHATDFSFTLEDPLPDEITGLDKWAVIGLYDSDHDGVSISFDNTDAQSAINQNHVWNDYFYYGGGMGLQETDVADALRTGQSEWMLGSLGSWWCVGDYFGSVHTLVNFSGATDGGSVYAQATPVPEPLTLTMAAPLVALVVAGREQGS